MEVDMANKHLSCDIMRLEELAKQGNLEAKVLLGKNYFHGIQVTKDEDKGRQLLQEVAKQTDTAAGLWARGYCFECAIGCNRDPKAAFNFYQQAVKKDPKYAPALNSLGIYYEHGIVVGKSIAFAIQYYRTAAQLEYPPALCNLAECFLKGRGVAKDVDEARRNFYAAAELGSVVGQYKLWELLPAEAKKPNSVKDDNVLLKFLKAAANSGYAKAQYALGIFLCSQNSEVWRFFGNPPAHFEGVEWYKKAAVQGLPEAAHILAIGYEEGRVVKKDLEEALKYYKIAAERKYQNSEAKVAELLDKLNKDGESTPLLASNGNGIN
jgi:TPR repeat protein